MKKLLIALLLAGCAHTEPVIQTVEVKVPVYIPCSQEVQPAPEYATKKADPDANIWDQSKALRQEIDQRKAREKLLEAAIEACKDNVKK